MRSFILLKNIHDYDLPKHLQEHDVRYTHALVRYFLETYTVEGNTVFDPFAGFGTTLYTAQEMGRRPYGLEYSAQKHAFIEQNLSIGRIIHGDARQLLSYDLPEINFSMTSPPYMHRHDSEVAPSK